MARLRKMKFSGTDGDKLTISEYSGLEAEATSIGVERDRLVIVIGQDETNIEIRVLPCIFDEVKRRIGNGS